MADKNFPDDDEIFELTDLIESGTATQAGGAAAYAKAASAANNFESFLSDLNDDDTDSAVDANEKLDMSSMGDIEDLLDSFDIPAQPASAPASKPSPVPKAAPEPEPKPTPESAAPTDELDSLLDDWLDPDKGAAKPAPPSPDPGSAEIDADLNSILNESEDLTDAASPEEPEHIVTSSGVEDIDLPEPPDFDNLSSSASPAEEEILTEIEETFPDIPVMEKAGAQGSTPENIASVPSGVYSVQPMREMGVAPEMLANICGGIVKAQGTATEEALRDFAHKLGHQEGDLENLEKRVEELANALKESGRELAETKSQLALLEKNSHGLEELFSEGTPLNSGFMKLVAAVVGKALENGKEPVQNEALEAKLRQFEEDLAPARENLDNLAARLEVLEAERGERQEQDSQPLELLRENLDGLRTLFEPVPDGLRVLGERISQLENDAAAPVNIDATEILARLDRMEGQEAAILAKFAGVEGRLDSLESGLGEAMLKIDEMAAADIGERLDNVVHVQKSINARIDALEKRLDDLEPRFNADIEKAAAKVVVKILHEEIAGLMAGN